MADQAQYPNNNSKDINQVYLAIGKKVNEYTDNLDRINYGFTSPLGAYFAGVSVIMFFGLLLFKAIASSKDIVAFLSGLGVHVTLETFNGFCVILFFVIVIWGVYSFIKFERNRKIKATPDKLIELLSVFEKVGASIRVTHEYVPSILKSYSRSLRKVFSTKQARPIKLALTYCDNIVQFDEFKALSQRLDGVAMPYNELAKFVTECRQIDWDAYFEQES